MSLNPNKVDVVTSENRKKMINIIVNQIKKFPKKSVSENLVEFTERKRKLIAGSSARPGLYKFETTPFWREPSMNMSENSKIVETVIKKATQTGGTELLLNHTLYCIEYGIGPVCYVSSDEGLAVKHSETRIAPMLQACGMQKEIQAPVKTKSNKGTGNKNNLKFFKGTFLQLIGARSESKASSTPIRIVHYDEVDKYPLQLSSTQGGSPIVKIRRRTDSYGNLRKELFVSTPKRAATSVINPLYKQGDCREYHVECPSCKKLHKLEWSRIKWDKNNDGGLLQEYDEDNNLINDPVWHECPHCEYKMRYHERHNAMQEEGFNGHAKWIPSKKPDRAGIRSYHLSGLYGFLSWTKIVQEFLEAKDDPILLEDFICDTLGDVWEASIDKPDENYLQSRLESDWSRGDIPSGVKILTLGVDIHPKRIDYHLMGWGDNKECWSIDFDSLYGDIWETYDESWDKLEEVINKPYQRLDGKDMRLNIVLVDAQGQAAPTVKDFCKRFPYTPNNVEAVYPALGKTTVSGIVKEHESGIETPELLIDDQSLKREIYNSLKKKKPAIGERFPYGFLHFHSDYHEKFFKELTAEEISEVQNAKGTATEYFIHNKKQRDNHVLDCTKMCLAGLYHMYFGYFKRLNKWQKDHKKKEIPSNWATFWSLFGND